MERAAERAQDLESGLREAPGLPVRWLRPFSAATAARPAAPPSSDTGVRPRRRSRRGRVMLWVRRTHLYFGLALLPWVALYGASALLFNHASWWSGAREELLSELGPRGAALRPLQDADRQARDVLDGLAARAGIPAADLRLVEHSARWIGALQLEGSGRAQTHGKVEARFALDPLGRGGVLRLSEARVEPTLPAWAGGDGGRSPTPTLDDAAREPLFAAAGELARGHAVELESTRVRRLPALEFQVRDDGARLWSCSVAADGKLEVVPGDAPTDWRRRLLRLHVQHGDPGFASVRRVWFAIVDVVGFAMLMWGLSGVVMWWTLRPTRRLGGLALAVGAVAMVVVALGLWAESGV